MEHPKSHFRNPEGSIEDSTLQYSRFVRKPFIVEAIEVTKDNITELAEFIGTLRKKSNGTPYIQVNRWIVPNVLQVYPGFWMTRMGDNIRCYSKRIFTEQFIESSADIDNWVEFLNNNPSTLVTD